MKIHPSDRLALFIDGPNFWGATKALGFEVDYQKLSDYFGSQARLVRMAYYTAMDDRDEFTPVRPLVDWLDYHSWHVVTRQKDTDVDLAVGMLAMVRAVDHFILASGNSDFCSAVEAVQRRGCRVSVLSTVHAHGAGYGCADELRRAADNFIDLEELRQRITRIARVKEAAVA